MTHEQAKKELANGTPAELICATCPWDRLCVMPPSMSSQEIERQIEDAKRKDEERDPEQKSMPVGMLMTALAYGGRDQTGTLCPVFALRLRGLDGRQVADSIRTTMRSWGDS
jgi:hypothetical protein